MKFGVVVFPGTWSDRDCGGVVESLSDQGAELTYLWHRDRDLKGSDCVILPGGFSYGDHLRAGAIAATSPIMGPIREFAAAGGLVWGICNGFQILCEARLLPGALVRNHVLEFRCMWTHLVCERADIRFTRTLAPGQVIRVPVSHQEGCYLADAATLSRLEQNGQVVFRYADAAGHVRPAASPNGSAHGIAGIVNEAGNVLGMMPHPERASDVLLGGTDGRLMFESVLRQKPSPALAH
ncbi:MAG: phosphoribosylformylglycinamidine synthase subunit PurQ [Candidatus Dormibacteraeota bacterium]|nr:phosphoribosylformylglycinamidine synthase subunit PurQ [Candidatus Dormibacteraeota bacterium]